MKKYIQVVLLIVGTVVLVPALPAAQTMQFGKDSAIRMIRPVGQDGAMYYAVYCKNGFQGSVAVHESPKRVCIGPPRQCRGSWSLRPAAEELCR